MSIRAYIYILGLIIWLFPAIRQRNSRFFYYFFLLAIADSVSLVIYEFLKIYPSYIFIVVTSLQIVVLQNIKVIKLPSVFVAISLFLSGLLLWLFPNKSNYSMMFLESILLIQFIRLLIIEFFQKEEFNIFLILLVFYETSVVLNMIVLFIEDGIAGLYLHEITVVFQFLIALFFSIFREENPRLQIKLNGFEENFDNNFEPPNS